MRLYRVINWTVDVSVSTFWSVEVWVNRRFGLSTSWFAEVLVCRRFGLSTFRFVEVSVCPRFGCRHFGLSTFWPITYERVHFITSKPGHHFADDITKWISSMTSISSIISILLLKYNLHFALRRPDISNIFPTFRYFNPSFSPLVPRIKYRTCLRLWPHISHAPLCLRGVT